VIGIVLEIWEATDDPLAALVKIERGLDIASGSPSACRIMGFKDDPRKGMGRV